ncbi:hypothetical protein CT0861_09274 [Colletotrichum tofieldiae]|uniref:Zn(2)-C6 fungal-type domain-containing protein n=1 Tax=Colletotrichum tofieldiae TaxID=708197 RepID=A0A161YCP4_9PEZI|nr:hypothetical protein CT0861_09274 [Colletotrichum tofieldiae]
MQAEVSYTSDSAEPILRPARGTCDNCSLKKVRCPGERPACSRCLATSQTCHYSPKMRMGRPKTRRLDSKLSGVRPRRRVVPDAQSSTPSSTDNQRTSIVPRGHTEGAQQNTNDESGPTLSGQNASHLESNGGPAAPYVIDFETYERYEGRSIHACNISITLLTQLMADRSMRSNPFIETQITNPLALAEQHATDSCACLSIIYLLLDKLKSKHKLSAPDDLVFLRNCVNSAVDVLTCTSCPMRYLAIIQNAVLLGVFCLCLAESYARILDAIDEEEKQARNMGIEKQLIVQSGTNDAIQYSYSPTTNTSASFSVKISPTEWGSIMRRVVKKEIFGAEDHKTLCLVTLIDRLEQRQKCWHELSLDLWPYR